MGVDVITAKPAVEKETEDESEDETEV